MNNLDTYNYTTYPPSEPEPRRIRFRFKGLPHDRPYLNVILFILTIFSTYLTAGLWYAIPIITILLAHEMGHYVMCRRYGVIATLPFFIPFPIANPFGTMGAVIQMKGAMPSRRALFDIGAAGPLAGLILAIPTVFFGISHSQIIAAPQMPEASLILGESLLFKLLAYLAVGNLPEGQDILMHPAAYAGWAGLFVTALNLLPIGQLDGGHILYSIFGKLSTPVNFAFLGLLGVLTFIYPGWALLFALLLIFGRKHPAPMDDFTPLDRKRKILGVFIFLFFVLSFTPVPIKL